MRSLASLPLIVILGTSALASPYESGGKVEEFIGAYTESIPIQVPTFHGIEPKLSLQYHSGRGTGYVGVGWSLQGLSVIEVRDAPSLGTRKRYYLDGQLLVECSDQVVKGPACEPAAGTLSFSQWLSTQSESYLRVELGFDPTNASQVKFVVWKPDGTRHVYARASSFGPSGRYVLSQVIDTSGNTVTYEWSSASAGANPNTNIPTRIHYNGTVIDFRFGARTLPETFAELGRLETMSTQLRVIDVCVNPSATSTASCLANGSVDPNRARTYALQYKTSASTTRPLLTSVTMFGKDARVATNLDVTGTSTVPVTFSWSDRAPSYSKMDIGMQPQWGHDAYRGMVDFDGDGKNDYCRDTSSMTLGCAISTGNGFTERTVGTFFDWGSDQTWIDWNGDGRSDFCRMTCVTDSGRSCWGTDTKRNYRILCALSTGTGINDTAIGSAMINDDAGGDGARWFVDWNGDGRGDLCRAIVDPWNGLPSLKCALSTGTSYTERTVGVLGDAAASHKFEDALGYAGTRAFVDWNGDGRTDFCRIVDGPQQYQQGLKCLLGQVDELDRSRFDRVSGTDTFMGVIDIVGPADTQWYVDVNGDGSTDYCRMTHDTQIKCAISTQIGFQDVVWATRPNGFGVRDSPRWGDMDGDHKMDMCFNNPGHGKECLISQGLFGVILPNQGIVEPSWTNQHWMVDWDGDGRTEYCFTAGSANGVGSKMTCIKRDSTMLLDLVTATFNGMGGGSTVIYAPATKFQSGRVRIPVVESFTRHGGQEGNITQTFRYAGASYDAFTRRFLGFRTVQIQDACLANEAAPWQCPLTEIESRLDPRWPTAPARISRFAGQGGLELNRQELTYADTTTVPFRSDLIRDTRTQYEGMDTVATRRRFEHDKFGNITKIYDDGLILDSTNSVTSLLDDDRTLTTTFAPDIERYIVDKPTRVTGSDASGTLTDVKYTYDTRGLATRSEIWLDTANAFVQSSFAYDSAGNLISETDRNGQTTNYTYDSTYRTFVIETTLPPAGTPAVRLVTRAEWDPRCGLATKERNQVNQSTDVTYDAVCRRTRTQMVPGAWEQVAYHDYAFPYDMPYTVVTTPGSTSRAFSMGPNWKRTHYDGMGRVAKIMRNGPTPTTEIIETEMTYNARGKLATQTKPRYATDPVFTTTFTYDRSDREIEKKLPPAIVAGRDHPGDTTTTTYSMLRAVVRDGLGTPEMTKFDIHGRPRVTGNTDGSFHTYDLTHYTYDRRGNVATISQSTHVGAALATVEYTWDSLGRKTSVRESNSGVRTFQYDNKDNVLVETDAAGIRTEHSYDALDRRTFKATYPCVRRCTASILSTWAYDEPRAGYANLGRLTSSTDASGVATYDYNEQGHLIRGGRTVNGAGPYMFTKTYDGDGRVTSTLYPDRTRVGTPTNGIRYDDTGRIYSIPGLIDSATYDAAGKLTSYKTASGAEATYETSNPRGQVSGYTFKGNKATGSVGVVGEYELTNSSSGPYTPTRIVLPTHGRQGDTVTVSTCGASVPGASGTGDTYLRLRVRPTTSPYEVPRAFNDNATTPGCAALSTVTYTLESDGEVIIYAGCATSGSCSGTIAVRHERGNQNIALNKSVLQSTILDASCGPTSSVVDGNVDGRWCSASSMLHTEFEMQPYLMIDLGSEQDITRVDVYNRTDTNLCDQACLDRLANFDVSVWSATGWALKAYVPHVVDGRTQLAMTARSRYVLLQLRDRNYLNTPEVQVFGPVTGPQPVLDTQPVFEQARLYRLNNGKIASVLTNRTRTSWWYTYSNQYTRQLTYAESGDPTLTQAYDSDNGNLSIAHPTAYGVAPGAPPHAVTQSGVDRFSYDVHGQRVQANLRSLTWNLAHQLEHFDGVSYSYDADGLRLTKTYDWNTTTYLGNDYEINGATGAHTKYITLGGRLVARQTTSGDTTYLFTDHLGSVVLGLDPSGEVTESRSYGPFGLTIAGDDAGRGYTGQRKDENGLLYLHARYYDPYTGRFISPDPTVSSHHPIGMNRYAYAMNDPINRTDLDGLGMWDNVHSDLGEAARQTSHFLSHINLVDMMQWISNRSGHRAPVKKFLGGFNIGVGKSLALIVGKFHAAAEEDWDSYGKMMASELVISAAVAASILTYGKAAAPAVAIINSIALPTALTFIQTQNLDDTRDVFVKKLPGVAQKLGEKLVKPAVTPLFDAMKNEAKEGLGWVGEKLFGGSDGGGGMSAMGAISSVVSTLIDAEPYIVIDPRMHAQSVSPQTRLSSSSGTLFGPGYKR
ncbi:MAG: RHS repeat-associated core domain-containing protein [Kofleriaceae bacterium]